MGGRVLPCIYCKNVSIHTADKWIKVYVCDDCYEKKQHRCEEIPCPICGYKE